MVRAILLRWPRLTEEFGCYEDSFSQWRRWIRTTFKNARSRLGDDIPEVDVKRSVFSSKRKREISMGTVTKKACTAWGVENYLPERYEGEDETSQALHRDRLCEQSRLSVGRRNDGIIKISMDKTFPARRSMIIVEMARIEDVIHQYHILTCENEVTFF